MSWRQAFSAFLKSGRVITMATGLTGTGAYVSYTDWMRDRRMMNTYATGNILPPMIENTYETVYFPRPKLEQTLRRILGPTFSNEYYLISGDVGTGKTRSVVEVIRSMMVSDGQRGLGAPIYVLASQGNSFAETLSAAIGFQFDEHISFRFFVQLLTRINSMPRRDDSNRLTRVLNAVEKSAFSYMQLYGRPVVIVIDGVDWLLKYSPSTVDHLLDKAKVWADANIVKLVLIINDTETESQLMKNVDACSRLATPILVDDLRQGEALAFLRASYLREQDRLAAAEEATGDGKMRQSAGQRTTGKTMDDELAGRIVALVGGRILQLIAMKRDWLYGVSFDDSADELKNREREKLLQVWKTESHWRVMEAIHSAAGHRLTLSSLLERVSLADVQTLAKMNVVVLERDQRQRHELVAFRSQLTLQVFDDIRQSLSRKRDQ